jgi:hypothetical protein
MKGLDYNVAELVYLGLEVVFSSVQVINDIKENLVEGLLIKLGILFKMLFCEYNDQRGQDLLEKPRALHRGLDQDGNELGGGVYVGIVQIFEFLGLQAGVLQL